MKCTLMVGQKVTPAPRGPWEARAQDGALLPIAADESPVYGAIYTVAWVGVLGAEALIKLRELPADCAYLARAFRPLNERPQETDISIFTKLLGSKKPETVA